MPGGFLRRMFPIRISAQAKDKRQRVTVGKKIRLLPYRAEQIQRHYGSGRNYALQQLLRLFERRWRGRGLRAPHASFDKRWRRRRQLRPPRQIEAQRMLCQPILRILEGNEGVLLLAPVRRPCCLELLCCQNLPFARRLGWLS